MNERGVVLEHIPVVALADDVDLLAGVVERVLLAVKLF